MIAEAIANGRSLQAVRKEFGLSAAEIDDVLEKMWPVDLQARMRMIKRDVGRIDRLVQVFFQKALAGDVPSGLLVVRILERLHELCGLNAAAKIELIQAPREAPTSYERITEVIMDLTRGNGRNGNGTIDEPSPSDGNGLGGPAAGESDESK